MLQGRDEGPTRVSVAGEIVFTGREFYDFDAKYRDAPGIELVCPADLQPGELDEMQRIAARAFDAIGGRGLARVDFFFTGTDFIVNEINTMPGFTPISMFPACWLASGLSYPDLITELIELGLRDAALTRLALARPGHRDSSVSVHSSPFSGVNETAFSRSSSTTPGPDTMSRSTTTSTAGSRPKLVNSQ